MNNLSRSTLPDYDSLGLPTIQQSTAFDGRSPNDMTVAEVLDATRDADPRGTILGFDTAGGDYAGVSAYVGSADGARLFMGINQLLLNRLNQQDAYDPQPDLDSIDGLDDETKAALSALLDGLAERLGGDMQVIDLGDGVMIAGTIEEVCEECDCDDDYYDDYDYQRMLADVRRLEDELAHEEREAVHGVDAEQLASILETVVDRYGATPEASDRFQNIARELGYDVDTILGGQAGVVYYRN